MGKRKQVWAETTLRRHLREKVAERVVELDDPRVLAALDVADPVTVRTALHLGLDLAEARESDDGLFDEYDREAPTLAGVVPAFARHGRLGELIDAARDLTGPYRRAEALVAALSHLPMEDRAAIAVEALASVVEACRHPSPRLWWKRLDVLGLLAPQLGQAGMRQLAAELRGLARRTNNGVPPGDAGLAIVIESQLLLLVHASPPVADELAVDGLRNAARLRSEAARGRGRGRVRAVAPGDLARGCRHDGPTPVQSTAGLGARGSSAASRRTRRRRAGVEPDRGDRPAA